MPSSSHHVSVYSFYVRCCGSCEFAQHNCPRGVPWPRPLYLLAFGRRPDLVLQDHGIDTVSALHAAEGFKVVGAGVMQVVVPLGHEKARATSTGSRRELFAGWKGPNGFSTSVLFHRSATLRLFRPHFPFHDSASRLLVRCVVLLASKRHGIFSHWQYCSSAT